MTLTAEEQAELAELNRWMTQTPRTTPLFDPITRRALVMLDDPIVEIIRKGDRIRELERKAAP